MPFSEQEIEDLMQRVLWAFPVQMVGGFRSEFIQSINANDIQAVCKVLQSALKRVTPLPGTDALYQTMAPEYFDGCPPDLVTKYQNRLRYWNALNQLPDGTVIQEGIADNKRPRTVDFSLRLERLIKLGQVGGEVRKDWARRCDRKAQIDPIKSQSL